MELVQARVGLIDTPPFPFDGEGLEGTAGVKQHVFLALGQGRFEPREVKLGVEGDDGLREVLSGLKGGEEVVVSAQFLLDSESRFREAVQMMMPGMKMESGKEAAPPAPATPAAPPAPMPPGHKH